MRVRKHIRLKHYDYKSNGYYFVTICGSNKNIVAAERSSALMYNNIIENHLKNLEKQEGVKIDYYKLMPDHLHFILILDGAKLPLSRYIQNFKSKTALEIKKNGFTGKRFWQPNYYEHIIRNEMSLSKIRQYIENNPLAGNFNWAELDR